MTSLEPLSSRLLALSIILMVGRPAVLRAQDAAPEQPAQSQPETSAESAATEKVDINELIRTASSFTNSIGMELRKVTDALWVGTYEVTQKEYQEIQNANPSAFPGETHPVDSVSWNDAMSFCQALNHHEAEQEMLPDGYTYSLPTQSQWESLAANVPLDQAVTSMNNPRSGTAPVGSLGPSAEGLYDLRGNVAEWCADSPSDAYKVLRGGSWENWIDVNLRLQFRFYAGPGEAKNTFGFRCALIRSGG